MDEPRAGEEATRVRYIVLAFACVLSMITYLDRACFGLATKNFIDELGLEGKEQLNMWAVTAFAIAYAVFEIPTGWLGDVWGPRKSLLRIVIWWSIFTALTGIVGYKFGEVMLGGLITLTVVRFLFGAGEAGAYPNITRALHNWFPATQTSMAQGWIWMTGRLMGGLTPMVWTLLVVGTEWTSPLVTWRGAFLLFGIIGITWCAAFAWFFRDHPRDHSWVNAAERHEIEQGHQTGEASHSALPYRKFLRSGNLWLLCIMYFCMVYGWFFNMAYLPAYLQDRFEPNPQSLITALYKGGPLWFGAIGCLVGGYFVDWLIRRTGNRQLVRRYVGITAQLLSALGWLAAIFAPNIHCFFLAVSLAALCNDLTLASAWAVCQDIGQRYTAVTAACMNTIGTLGAVAASWLTGYIVQHALYNHATSLNLSVERLTQSKMFSDEKLVAEVTGYNFSFITYFAAYIVSAVCWRFIDPTKPIIPPEPNAQS